MRPHHLLALVALAALVSAWPASTAAQPGPPPTDQEELEEDADAAAPEAPAPGAGAGSLDAADAANVAPAESPTPVEVLAAALTDLSATARPHARDCAQMGQALTRHVAERQAALVELARHLALADPGAVKDDPLVVERFDALSATLRPCMTQPDVQALGDVLGGLLAGMPERVAAFTPPSPEARALGARVLAEQTALAEAVGAIEGCDARTTALDAHIASRAEAWAELGSAVAALDPAQRAHVQRQAWGLLDEVALAAAGCDQGLTIERTLARVSSMLGDLDEAPMGATVSAPALPAGAAPRDRLTIARVLDASQVMIQACDDGVESGLQVQHTILPDGTVLNVRVVGEADDPPRDEAIACLVRVFENIRYPAVDSPAQVVTHDVVFF